MTEYIKEVIVEEEDGVTVLTVVSDEFLRGIDGAIQYNAGQNIAIENDTIATTDTLTNIEQINFDITPETLTALTEGQLRWNSIEKTLDIGVDGNNVVLQVGQETFYPKCVNDDTVQIDDGTLVMYAGTVGGSGQIKIKRASTVMPLPALAMGIATENIAVGGTGHITWFGLVKGIQTNGANYGETWTDSTVIYNSGTVDGGLSKTKPLAPKSAVMVGVVVRAHKTNGILFVRPHYFPFVEHLSNVYSINPQNGDILRYNSNSLRWENYNGASGTFTTVDNKTVTVTNGIITDIV